MLSTFILSIVHLVRISVLSRRCLRCGHARRAATLLFVPFRTITANDNAARSAMMAAEKERKFFLAQHATICKAIGDPSNAIDQLKVRAAVFEHVQCLHRQFRHARENKAVDDDVVRKFCRLVATRLVAARRVHDGADHTESWGDLGLHVSCSSSVQTWRCMKHSCCARRHQMLLASGCAFETGNVFCCSRLEFSVSCGIVLTRLRCCSVVDICTPCR